MSRSLWATALTVCAVALAAFSIALMPGVALAASGDNAPAQIHHRVVVLGPGSGFPAPSRAVHALQARLAASGFSPGPVDGRFGPLTRAAVQRFQQADGLAVDGIVGPRTSHELAAGNLLPGAGSIQPAGSKAVERLQRHLKRLGFSPGAVDGRYGPRTTAAVRRFQHAGHLVASGIASAATLRALASSNPRPGRHPAPRPTNTSKPKATHNPAPAQPQPAPTNTNPAPSNTNPAPTSTQPAAHRPSGFPWTILLVFAALSIGMLSVFAAVTRRPKRRPAERQTVAPEAREPSQPAVHPVSPAVQPVQPVSPAIQPVQPVSEDPASSAAQIAALEAAVAMPSAGSSPSTSTTRTLDTPAILTVEQPDPSEDRIQRVKTLQRQLNWLGFNPGRVDGQYGPHTLEAVKRFQHVRGLPADGVARPATLAALQAGTPDRPFSGRVQRVKELQRELGRLGFEPGVDDGRYGPETTEAVKRFQRRHRLPDDGIADQATLQALQQSTPTPQPFTRRQERVKELQRQLTTLGLEPGPVDGRYGPRTTDAVRRLQRAHDLPVDGVADPVTLSTLNTSVKGTPFTDRTERVKELQRQLERLGLQPGHIDGRYGPQTTQAVKQFQETHNLPADGIAGPQTLHRIAKTTPTTAQHQLSQTQD